MHRLLLDAVDVRRLRDARSLEDGRADVDHVRELRAEAAPLLIRFGQWTTIGSRVPPRCEATCFPHWNGQLPAHAQAAE